MARFSGIREDWMPPEGWLPAVLPPDDVARRHLLEWLDDPTEVFNVVNVDFRGSDLSGSTFVDCYFQGCDFRGVSLRDADLAGTYLVMADLAGADFADAVMPKCRLGKGSMEKAIFDGANLTRAEIGEADARGASFRGATLLGTFLYEVDLRGADLSSTVVQHTALRGRVDSSTRFDGMSGELRGEVIVEEGGQDRELTGEQLEAYLVSRGAHVTVPPPRWG